MLLNWFTGFFFYFEQVIFWLIESAFAACKRLGHMLSQIATACSKSSYQTLKCEAIIINFDEALDIPFSKFNFTWLWCIGWWHYNALTDDFEQVIISVIFSLVWFVNWILICSMSPGYVELKLPRLPPSMKPTLTRWGGLSYQEVSTQRINK